MFDDFLAGFRTSWPVLPGSMAYLLGLAAAIGMILLLRDQDARDTGRLHSLGLALVGIGIAGWLAMGLWNVTVSMAMMVRQSDTYAVSAPLER